MKDKDIFKKRRNKIQQTLKEKFCNKKSMVVLNSGLKSKLDRFLPNSNFYYLTGLDIPDATLAIFSDGIDAKEALFLPPPNPIRTRWEGSELSSGYLNNKGEADIIRKKSMKSTGFSTILPNYELFDFLNKPLSECDVVLLDLSVKEFANQLHSRISFHFPFIKFENCAPIFSALRAQKEKLEIEKIQKAIDVTIEAHYAIMNFLKAGLFEYEVEALVNYFFLKNNARESFPTIIGSGKNSTILHYNKNSKRIESFDIVVCDLGARKDFYCSDLTRTFPANGKFTKEQLKFYEIVLEASDLAISKAKAGVKITDLNSYVKDFFGKKGVQKFYFHGVSHHIGLDVHDGGGFDTPLQENSVITIEPGLYNQKENIGIRIEDDICIKKNASIVLSDALPKDAGEIEKIMAKRKKRVIL